MNNETTFDNLSLEDEGSVVTLAIAIGAAVCGVAIAFFSGNRMGKKAMMKKIEESEKKIQESERNFEKKLQDIIKANGLKASEKSTPGPQAATT